MDLDRLWDLRQIEELKYRYVRMLDHKDWDGFADLFEPDATAAYGAERLFDGVDEIVGFMRDNLGPTMITLHQVHHPEIEIDGDEATGTWSLQDRVIMTRFGLLLDGYSTYHDRYRRATDGRWRIAHTGYERIYEHTVSIDDVPSFNLTENKFD